ncbi:MAG: glycosyltransferase, partial [Solirubrobacteraceae bacterium]
MPARWITPATRIEARRGEVVVCIPVYAGHEHFVGCLRSVLAHTPPDVSILVCDDASPDDRSERLVRKLHREGIVKHELFYVRRTENVGFPANVNDAFASCAPADVLLLNSDCVVADGWLDGLREAAGSQSNVATATSLTNHGSIVSVPERGVSVPRLPQDWSLDDAAAAVRARSPRLHPRLLTAIGHCVYVRRTALELVGDFDLAFSPGYGEEVDFSQRCLRAGLCHVAADDVLVFHHGGGSFATGGEA